MYLRSVLISFVCCCLILKVTGQVINVKGTIHKKSSPERVAEVIITNLHSKLAAFSDDRGGFHIPALMGDTLLFKKDAYAAQTFVVTGWSDAIIYLQPIVLLKEVNIVEESKTHEINDAINNYRKKGLYFDGRPPVSAFSPLGGSPITGLYELFGKDARNERHFMKITREETDRIAVRRRYTNTLIKNITGLTDDKEVQNFTDMFTPAYEDIKTWNDYELISYIKKSYDYYKDHKNGSHLPTLY